MTKLKLIVLSFVFLIIAVSLSVGYNFYTKKTPLLTLHHNYSRGILAISREGDLLAGDKVVGEFKSEDNFLGIVEIRFLIHKKVSSDSYIFRIKEKSAKEWYYTNTYNAKEFGGYPLFPFGFPIIANSKEKIYYFELESLSGKLKNAVGISTLEPVVTVRNVFSKTYLSNHKKELAIFSFKKIKEISQETNMPYYFIAIYILLVPLFFVKITLPKVNIVPTLNKFESKLSKKIGNESKRDVYLIVRFLTKLQSIGLKLYNVFAAILSFILKKLYFFHQWLGKK